MATALADLETEIDAFVKDSANTSVVDEMIENNEMMFLKYLPGKYVADVLKQQHLYAAERSGFTWGDALYVAPMKYPLATMMYGDVGVAGVIDVSSMRFFDATNSRGVDLYQQWIVYQSALYRELTTTVHANAANRELRNNFRTRFQIDCVYFRPDEACSDYVDVTNDLWLAITHWDATQTTGHGFSKRIQDLRWCVVGPDSFEPDGRGYRASLHRYVSASHSFVSGHYTSLEADIKSAYAAGAQVVICDFN